MWVKMLKKEKYLDISKESLARYIPHHVSYYERKIPAQEE
jgi:hypothetical protein